MDISQLEEQRRLEKTIYDEAKTRQQQDNLKAYQRGAWGESKIGRAYTRSATSAFADAVRAFIDKTKEKKHGKHMGSALKLAATGLEPETIAFLFTKGVFNQLALSHKRRIKRTSLCIRAADLLHDEWRIRIFSNKEERKNLLKKLIKQFDKRTYPRHWRKRTIINYFHAEQIEWAGWDMKDKLDVGYALLVLFRDSTGLVDAPKESTYVYATDALVNDFEQNMEKRVLDYMIYKPMVVPPLPWGPEYMFRGGYLNTRQVRRYPFIKGTKKRDIERLMSADLDGVMKSINLLQETPWRVNKEVLNVIEWSMYERGGGMAGLPLANSKPLPPAPVGYGTDEAITKEHDKLCFLIHNENREVISKRLAVLSTMTIAKQMKNFKAIYFPHNLDSRGRAYPLPAFLNPQGPDFTKALLEFAEGKPILTDVQAAWLAIAGANAYGNDKVSLQERVDWVQDNEEMIFSIAADPKSDLRWTEASEPFQFLRFCMEWKGFWDHGFGYVSHMVVPVDATCSGLQHYSAMLRDETGGRSVNLIPGLARQDIYQDVADRVTEKLMEIAERDGDPHARDWIKFGINRKITKRQVMVVPYAGTFSSCLSYTREAVAERLAEGYQCQWDASEPTEHNPRITLLAQLIWAAIDETVVKGKEAMRWLTDAARAYTKWANGQPGKAYDKRMSWVCPDGFEAVHFRPEESKHRLNTVLDGRVQLVYWEATDKLSAKDMSLAVAPNFVHSMDACHLRLTILKAAERGLRHFGMIHDSFGVHAADMDEFLEHCVKPAFIQMYQANVLEQYIQRLPIEVTAKLAPVPEFGGLVLKDIQKSEFFFS